MVERYFGEVDCGVPAEGTEKEWTSEVGLDRGTVETMLEGGRRVRAGEEYKIWNSRDVDGTLPDDYLSVLSRGEEMVGMRVGGVLEAFERRLVRSAKRL